MRLATGPKEVMMTSYWLHDDLSFCLVDGHPIFLDMGSDRYFRLSGSMERIFMNWLGNACEENDIALLVERKILTNLSARSRSPREPIRAPQLSALELPLSHASCGARILIEVFITVSWTQIQLKTIGIKGTVERGLRPDDKLGMAATGSDQGKLLAAAHDFLEARKLVPVGTRCLLDSLAMAKFLKRRRMRVNVIVGVTGDPFSAHCWVQAGDMVLNDALGNVRIYSPIRVL
ncbi:hypothetical protein RHOFW104T7_11835 [Rhodanobacter thiooxydans]|uniref:Microcin J25-processing protein McjB C-terminal domain-containing protein n=3 Tax=Rhodanobacter thiooxydans TaxID=416169 RepID=A0A154QI25_9GAMM|nr:hypothetical protein RHOFW104T7_11835 [Rhodanobacter thiooxydans]